jgi:hypothetical protein
MLAILECNRCCKKSFQGSLILLPKSLNFTNLLLIGYTAWKGFSQLGRGVVFCHIQQVNLANVSYSNRCSNEVVSTHFLTRIDLNSYLQEWIVTPETINHILQAVDTYNPQLDIIILVKDGSKIEVDILQNSLLAPLECYQQVCQRWNEFSCYIS